MKRLNVLDAAWLAVETAETPMHVANMQIFSLPEGASDTFLSEMVASMKSTSDVVRPWNLKLAHPSLLGRIIKPAWVKDESIDLDYHVRHSALPKPGGERELGILISRLHSIPMDFNRPLWESHIIEGLENNRFAIYTKMHHSLIDGVSGVRLVQRSLTTDPKAKNTLPLWSTGPQRKSNRGRSDNVPSVQGALQQLVETLKNQVSTVPSLVTALGRLVYSIGQENPDLAAPFVGPQSVLNKRVTPQRRIATQSYSLTSMKALSKSADCSLNDIVLYLCGTALRRFLTETDQLPDQALTAGIPVNVRPQGDTGTGTAISFMIASLATDVDDPLQRLKTVKESTRTAKDHLQGLPHNVMTQYTMLLMSPYILQLLTGMGGRMRPSFNFTISNVPGPKDTLYFNGAKLEAMYPLSLIAHGGALNITCLSYADNLNFGFTGCRDTLPSMQKLAVYAGEALAELESLINKPTTPKAKPRTRRKKPA